MKSHLFKWNYFRLSIVTYGFIYGFFFIDPHQVDGFPLGFTQLIVIFLFMPFLLIFLLGLQLINKSSSETWKNPSWFLNPLNLGQPLQFFHFASFFFIFIGVSSLISLIWNGPNCIYQAALPLSIGIGLLSGIHFSMLIFKNKIEKNKSHKDIYRFM